MSIEKFTHKNLTGMIVNRLRVEKYVGKSRWECICLACEEKGIHKTTIKPAQDLISGRSYSCGCCKKNNDIDLTGKRFEKLIALYPIKKDGRSMWHCQCTCQKHKEIDIRASDLLSGKAKSCGCMRHSNEAPNLIGQTFGYLTVIERVENDKNGRSMWKCKCNYNGCNNEIIVQGKKLLSGNTKSCGCLRKKHRYQDLTGKVFGKLFVESLAYIKDNITYWNCVCSCPNHTKKIIRGGDLKQNKIYSCGCASPAHDGSKLEHIIKEYIESLGVRTIKGSRMLERKEIDIFCPDYNIGIEVNGSVHHACLAPKRYKRFEMRDTYYHRDKFLLAKDKGIHLISLFDVDWEKNEEKICMYLSSLFLPQTKIYARKCEIKEIDKETAIYFTDKYHLQGANKFTQQINIGLYYNTEENKSELLAVMSFGKKRLKETKEGEYELHRYCVKDNYTIIGGAQKLMSYFERQYNPKYVLSYSDNDYFLGGIYTRLGFEYKGQSRPRYYWYLNGQEIRREKCMLKHLKELYPELLEEAYTMRASNKEDYVMTQQGAYKVYRSGNTKWEKIYLHIIDI